MWVFECHFLVRADSKNFLTCVSGISCRCPCGWNFTSQAFKLVKLNNNHCFCKYVKSHEKHSSLFVNTSLTSLHGQQETKLAAPQLGADRWKRWWSVIMAGVYSKECNGWPLWGQLCALHPQGRNLKQNYHLLWYWDGCRVSAFFYKHTHIHTHARTWKQSQWCAQLHVNTAQPWTSSHTITMRVYTGI